jgi:hypothetical protein
MEVKTLALARIIQYIFVINLCFLGRIEISILKYFTLWYAYKVLIT